MGWLLNQILEWLLAAILAAFDAIIEAIAHGLLITPDVTTLPQVQALTGKSTAVVDAVFVLAFVAAGALTMVAGGDEHAHYTVKDLVPRLIVGFVAAHFSQLFCRQAITIANTLTASVTSQEFDNAAAVTAIRSHLTAASRNQSAALLMAVIFTIIVILLAATAFSLLARICLLLVLTVAAPLALACHALPHTDAVARLWWRAYLGCLAVPTLQAFTLQAGQWMLLDPRHMLPSLPTAADPGSITNLFIVMVLLWTTVKIPGLVRRHVSQGGRSPNVIGMLARVVVVQQIGRAIPGLGRGLRAVAR